MIFIVWIAFIFSQKKKKLESHKKVCDVFSQPKNVGNTLGILNQEDENILLVGDFD